MKPPVMGITVVITTVMIITALALVVHAQYVPPPSPNIEFVYWSLSLNSTGYAAVGASGCVPSQQYSLYVFTQSQYNAWYSGHAVNAVYASTIGSTGSQLVILPAGDYVVVVYPAPSNYETCLELRYETSPFGMGISSAPSTPITTNAVMGFFNITSISGYSLYASEYNIPSGAVSLQLNAWLVVRLADGSTQYFWLQNTMSLLTQSNEFNLVVNVWNYTTYPSTPSNIVGGGSIQNSTEGYAYIYMTQNMTYSLPFSGYLVIAVEQAGSNTVNVGFGYVIIQSGSYEPPPQVVWYDNATITFNEPIEGAGIEISNQLTPSDLPLNAEFVFGGYSSGVPAVFNSLSAELALVYWSGTSWLPPPPNDYSFALTTAESATDLQVSMPGAYAIVNVGTPNIGLINPQPQIPLLPMTYVELSNPVTGVSSAFYVTQPYTVNCTSIINAGYGVRYVLTGYYVNGEFTTTPPVIEPGSWFATYAVSPTYQVQYLVSIASPLPITVNGVQTTNYTGGWVNAGSTLSIEAGRVMMSNGTMLVPGISNESITVNAPMTMSITWTPYYLVSIASVLPIYVNGNETTNYVGWVARGGSTLLIEANSVVLSNGTMFKPSISNETITVNSPTSLSITWTTYYLVTVSSNYPVIVNGSLTTSFSGYVRAGSSIGIEAKPIPEYWGLITLRPNATELALTIDKPTTVTITYTPNYTNLVILIMAIAVATATTLLIKRRK